MSDKEKDRKELLKAMLELKEGMAQQRLRQGLKQQIISKGGAVGELKNLWNQSGKLKKTLMVGGALAGGVAIGAAAVGTFALGVSAGVPVIGAGIGAYAIGSSATYAISKITGSRLINRAVERELQKKANVKEEVYTVRRDSSGVKGMKYEVKRTVVYKDRNPIKQVSERLQGFMGKFGLKSKSNSVSNSKSNSLSKVKSNSKSQNKDREK